MHLSSLRIDSHGQVYWLAAGHHHLFSQTSLGIHMKEAADLREQLDEVMRHARGMLQRLWWQSDAAGVILDFEGNCCSSSAPSQTAGWTTIQRGR